MSTTELTTTDLKAILVFTISIARQAGALILEGSSAIQRGGNEGQDEVNEKKNSVDLVTEYDVRVEELVKSEIRKEYPSFQFIGEESYSAGSRPPLTDEPTFCVDPIDGTTNFIHGFPFACISLGLIYKRRPVLGVIYNPFLDHLYTGITSQGSHLTIGSQLHIKLPLQNPPKSLPSLHDALIAVEWGSDRKSSTMNAKSSSFVRLAGDPENGVQGGKMAHSLRSMGSAALNYGMVAQGGLDMYWEIGCWPWDVCAGIVIAQEAGGVVVGSHEAVSASEIAGVDIFDVTEEILTGRKYLVVRAIGDTKEETGRQAQMRIIKEFYASVEDAELN